jgi:hypothetical protein
MSKKSGAETSESNPSKFGNTTGPGSANRDSNPSSPSPSGSTGGSSGTAR